MVPFIHAARDNRRIPSLCILHERYDHVRVHPCVQYLMMQDELVLIFQKTNRKSQLCQNPRFTLVDPACMRLMD